MYDEKQSKARRKAFREAASQVFGKSGTVSVSKDAHVHPTNGGAFVEAQVWVSDELADIIIEAWEK